MNIYLIGMPLSGKSTLGKKLSERLKCNFIDVDSYIKDKTSSSINEIFANKGEEYFRNIESTSLKEIKDICKNTIISCGGGVVVKEENKEYLNGIVIYLDVDIEILKTRLLDDDTRPILRTNKLEELYNQRKDKYISFSNHIVKHSDIEKTLEQILKILNQ